MATSPNTSNISNTACGTSSGGCAGDSFDPLPLFITSDGDKCTPVNIPEGKIALITGLNLVDGDIVTAHQVFRDKCGLDIVSPYNPGGCWQIDAEQIQLCIANPGTFRICLNSDNQDARASIQIIDACEGSCPAPRPCPCIETVWEPTGNTRCGTTNVEVEQVSNCGNKRWVTSTLLNWIATGNTRCSATNIEVEQENDCGRKRWTTGATLTWTRTGEFRCVGSNVELQESNDCGKTRWVTGPAQTWTSTGTERCRNNVAEILEKNDCGAERWTATAGGCGFCASVKLPECGYAFDPNDVRDPAASVPLEECGTGIVLGYIYPTSGPGHNVEVSTGCTAGEILGYAVNRSECSPECDCENGGGTSVAEVHKTPATISIGGVPVVGTGPELQDFDLPAYPTVPAQLTLCELMTAALGTPVTPLGTDKVQVQRADGSCATIDLQSLINIAANPDVQIASVTNTVYNPATGVMTLTITESNGDVYPVTFTVGPFLDTTAKVVSTDRSVDISSSTAGGVETFDLRKPCVDCGMAPDMSANAIELTETQLSTLAPSLAVPPSLLAGAPVEVLAGTPSNISFAGTAGEVYLLQVNNYRATLGAPVGDAVLVGTGAVVAAFDRRIYTDASSSLQSEGSLFTVKVPADGPVSLDLTVSNSDVGHGYVYSLRKIDGDVDYVNPVTLVGTWSYNAAGGYTSEYAPGQYYSMIEAGTRGGIPASTPMATFFYSRHSVAGTPLGSYPVNNPVPSNTTPFLSLATAVYAPALPFIPNASLNELDRWIANYQCPLAITALNNPPDGLMNVERDSTGFGVVQYVALNAAPGGGAGGSTEIGSESIALTAPDCANCCETKTAMLGIKAGTISWSLAPGSKYTLTFTLNAESASVSLWNPSAAFASGSLAAPQLVSLMQMACGTSLSRTAAVSITADNYVADANNTIQIVNFGVFGG